MGCASKSFRKNIYKKWTAKDYRWKSLMIILLLGDFCFILSLFEYDLVKIICKWHYSTLQYILFFLIVKGQGMSALGQSFIAKDFAYNLQ